MPPDSSVSSSISLVDYSDEGKQSTPVSDLGQTWRHGKLEGTL